MKKKELELLLKLACNRQSELLIHKMWDSSEYKTLEHIKVKLKNKIKSKTKSK